jgi:hypothetical protein
VVWQAPATSGTVTSVGVSSSTGIIVASTPVTSSGTITVNLPGSGGSSAVVAGDLLVGGSGSYAALAKGTNGQVLTVSGGATVWGSVSTFALQNSFDSGNNSYVAGASVPGSLGSQNVVFTARAALPALTSGSLNVLFADAGNSLSSGSQNAIFGLAEGAGRNLSTGTANSIFGSSAGQNIVAGDNNTFVGFYSGYNVEGSNNTFVGRRAGQAQTSLNNSTIIGESADVGSNTLTNVIVIGKDAVGSASNSAVIGNVDITNLGIGTTAAITNGLQLGSSSLGGFFTPQSASKTIIGNGGVFWVDTSNNPKFTNSTASYTLATSSSAFTWNTVSGTTQTLAANNGYICTNAGQTTATLPATASVGDTYEISAYTAAGWRVLPGTTTQIMRIGNAATTASTGSLASTQIGDTLRIVCMNASVSGSEVFVVTSSMGNITVV